MKWRTVELLKEQHDFDKYAVICENLVKIYKTKDIEVLALQGLDLMIEHGEIMAIIGNSGSGKTTLMNMLGGLERPSAGKLYVNGKNLFKLNDKELNTYKTETVGFVWQNNARNLIPYLTALENVLMPMEFNLSAKIKNKKERARELLALTGIDSRASHKLSQLSGGEQQRVAIAIALANNPKILLADEPTGSVDTHNTDLMLAMFNKINQSLGTTIIIVTHDRQISKKVKRVVAISDGRISSEFIMREGYAQRLAGLTGFGQDKLEDEDGHQEYVVLDRAGRLQVPKEYLDKVDVKDSRMVMTVDGEGRIILTPEQDGEEKAVLIPEDDGKGKIMLPSDKDDEMRIVMPSDRDDGIKIVIPPEQDDDFTPVITFKDY
jgi:ABC-type lipoprotein export system ATPase subunit/bifunctional DNA-binding transcriptional regulator/antitoxin component of YhaV-PrlF toxin-antitoxin module